MKFAVSLLIVFSLYLPGPDSETKFPGDISGIVSVADILAETNAKSEYIKEKLSDQKTYEDANKKVIQAAGVLACLGHTLSLHKEGSSAEISGLALRETAIELAKSESFDEATKAYAKLQSVLEGKTKLDEAPKRVWKDLIDMHSMMKEVNTRNSRLRRVVRRSRKPETDSLHASTLAILSVVMHEDTHKVKDKANIPVWRGYSIVLQKSMTELSAAIKKKDTENGKNIYKKATKACRDCHKKFRVEVD